MITVADLHAAATRQVKLASIDVIRERQHEADGVAWALENKTSHSDAAWKQRYRAERRHRAAQAVASALTAELISELSRS